MEDLSATPYLHDCMIEHVAHSRENIDRSFSAARLETCTEDRQSVLVPSQ